MALVGLRTFVVLVLAAAAYLYLADTTTKGLPRTPAEMADKHPDDFIAPPGDFVQLSQGRVHYLLEGRDSDDLVRRRRPRPPSIWNDIPCLTSLQLFSLFSNYGFRSYISVLILCQPHPNGPFCCSASPFVEVAIFWRPCYLVGGLLMT